MCKNRNAGRAGVHPLPAMLHISCLQQWYGLSDPGAEEALYDIHSMRAFAGPELGRDAIPDETTATHHAKADRTDAALPLVRIRSICGGLS